MPASIVWRTSSCVNVNGLSGSLELAEIIPICCAFSTMVNSSPTLISQTAVRSLTLKLRPITAAVVSASFSFSSIHLWDQWYFRSAEANWTIGWRRHYQTMLPLSAGLGRTIISSNPAIPPMSAFVTAQWMVYRQFAPVAPQTTINFALPSLFRNSDRFGIDRIRSVRGEPGLIGISVACHAELGRLVLS